MIHVKNAEDLVQAMAYDREQFKDKVEEKIGGALLEHYKAALAGANRPTRWVEHWQGEVDRLLDTELVVVLLHTVKGFKDRRKAAREVLLQLRSADARYRRAAERVVKKDYGLRRLAASLSDEVTDSFYRRVEDVIATHA